MRKALVVVAISVIFVAAGWAQDVAFPSSDAAAEDRPVRGRESEREWLERLRGGLSSDSVGPGNWREWARTPYSPSPQEVTSTGYSIVIEGDLKLGRWVFKSGAPFIHTVGGPKAYNTGLGRNALKSATPGRPNLYDGYRNTALGQAALFDNTSGGSNTAIGARALYSNTTGSGNIALGYEALVFNTTGNSNIAIGGLTLALNEGNGNIAIGDFSLLFNDSGGQNIAMGTDALYSNTSGSLNLAIGRSALYYNKSGERNIGLGRRAGYYNSSGSDNIFIGAESIYPGSENNTLRIGNGTGTATGKLNRVFISGIKGVALAATEPHVCINDMTNRLGLCDASSARVKEDVEDMADESEGLFGLRPVKFRYTEEFVGEGERAIQYGLIAEEVVEVFPGLVTLDSEGQPATVRYEALTPLLLRELQRQREIVAALEIEVAGLWAVVAEDRGR